MRLINTETLQLTEFFGEIPKYAILSHTWEEDEVRFTPTAGLSGAWIQKGFLKIRATCARAVEQGIAWAWVDTCCIDKSSSAELSEAINSMYEWYRNSAVCYVYLSDLTSASSFLDGLPRCRWITRGWTLQELIAPSQVEFLDRDWRLVATKERDAGLLANITGIPEHVLKTPGSPMSMIPAGRRMSWAANRKTTRPEDEAYCLLGIFDVNMPLLYGEGTKAFERLQHEIIRKSNDRSIFAWTALGAHGSPSRLVRSSYTEIIARSPAEFKNCRELVWKSGPRPRGEFTLTNFGLRMPNLLKAVTMVPNITQRNDLFQFPLGCAEESDEVHQELAVYLQQYAPSLYIRVLPGELSRLPHFLGLNRYQGRDFYLWTPDVAEPLYINTNLVTPEESAMIPKYLRSGIRFEVNDTVSMTADPPLDVVPSSMYNPVDDAFLPGSPEEFWARRRLHVPDPNHIYIVCGRKDHKIWFGLWKGEDTQSGFPKHMDRRDISRLSPEDVYELMSRNGFPGFLRVDDPSPWYYEIRAHGDYRQTEDSGEASDFVVTVEIEAYSKSSDQQSSPV